VKTRTLFHRDGRVIRFQVGSLSAYTHINNIKMDRKKKVIDGANWIQLAQDRVR